MLQISNRCLSRVSKGCIGGEGLLEREMESFDVHGEERFTTTEFGPDLSRRENRKPFLLGPSTPRKK
jgi:hypothetical protein